MNLTIGIYYNENFALQEVLITSDKVQKKYREPWERFGNQNHNKSINYKSFKTQFNPIPHEEGGKIVPPDFHMPAKSP